jgi:hypothetical protein
MLRYWFECVFSLTLLAGTDYIVYIALADSAAPANVLPVLAAVAVQTITCTPCASFSAGAYTRPLLSST